MTNPAKAVTHNDYDLNPISVIDQDKWTVQMPEVALAFRTMPVIYTPLIDWTNETQQSGAQTTYAHELMEGDVDTAEIPMTANYIDSYGVDSRSRKFATARYGDKVQLHKSSNIFTQWKKSGGRDWRPLLRGLLGYNVIRKHELLSRNSFLLGPKSYWTYSSGSSFASLTNSSTFNIGMTNQWNLRLGQTGSPVIPGDMAAAKLAIIPSGVVYDFRTSLAAASSSEASMWRDSRIYAGQALRYEMGEFNGVRFLQVPNNKFGLNDAVLYNSGSVLYQYAVTSPITAGDGAPDPETTPVDDVWYVGQKDVTHYIQLEGWVDDCFAEDDLVTIHTSRTNIYGVVNGVNPLHGKSIVRRVVNVDNTNHRLSFDRPVMFNYTAATSASSLSGSTLTATYAFVTKARHVGMCLVLGARGGVLGSVAQPIEFYEPEAVDDFKSVWRYSWDEVLGYNIWEPNLFELHFCSLSLAKAGGVITP